MKTSMLTIHPSEDLTELVNIKVETTGTCSKWIIVLNITTYFHSDLPMLHCTHNFSRPDTHTNQSRGKKSYNYMKTSMLTIHPSEDLTEFVNIKVETTGTCSKWIIVLNITTYFHSDLPMLHCTHNFSRPDTHTNQSRGKKS